MLKALLCSFVVIGILSPCYSITISSYISNEDIQRYKTIFERPYVDNLFELKYALTGLELIKSPIPDSQKACDALKSHVNLDDLESSYLAVYILKTLERAGKSCNVQLQGAEEKFKAAISSESNTRQLLYAVNGLNLLGRKYDSKSVASALEAAIKSDDSPMSYSSMFYAASLLPDAKDMKKFHDMIEDIIAQADEIDEKYLQFDSGLGPTAAVVYTAYKLSAAAKIPPTIPEDKVVKLVNYLMNRKHTENRMEALFLLQAIKELASSQFNTPVSVSLASLVSVSTKSPVVQVHVCNLLGESLPGKLSVMADTARHVKDDAVVLSKKPLTVASSNEQLYELDFMKVNPKPGFYRLVLSVSGSSPSKLLAASGAEVEIKVTTSAVVENVELSVADKDQSSVPKSTKLQYPGKTTLEADHHQKIVLKFAIKDKISKQSITAHQAFVRLTHVKTKQDVIFVAEEENDSTYKFDFDVGAKSKDFLSLSGTYNMELVIGDSVIENPISWLLGEVKLTFHDDPVSAPSKEDQYMKKPEIEHIFRKPEKRPPKTVSTLFTGLVLAPVLVLFILWLKIGVNISNCPFSLSALGFHAGITAIFCLYGFYFLHLTMFQTLRYLGLIGIPTFLFGHKLLSGIAAKGGKQKD